MLQQKPEHFSPGAKIKECGMRLGRAGLSPGCTGNISIRVEEGFLISPSATPYEELDPANVAMIRFTDDDETIRRMRPKPSSEWRFHKAICLARQDVHAIVHCHSHYAQVLACSGNFRELPRNFHYMMQLMGGDVQCMPYETPGSERLAVSAVTGLGTERKVVLLANHGPVVAAESLEAACDIMERFEELCRIFVDVKKIGIYAPIPADKVQELPALFENYQKKK